jgi:feruloyl esterase
MALPAHCRIRGMARPTPQSQIGFELWLPTARWNGRYYQLGNGGFAGNIHAPSLAAEVARGNAAAATDTGHTGTGFDASWAAGQPERVVDYGHRSLKATSDAAGALIVAYYGRPANRRYFAGCSNGGRQALMVAQRYPGDWDGIVAGAPANRWTRQLASFAALQHQLRAVPGGWLPAAKLPAIQRQALAGCSAEAGVKDGVAADPRHCRFDPAAMLCRDAETDACLTAAQVTSVRMIRQAGYEATTAAVPGAWDEWIVQADAARPSQLTFATQAVRYLGGAGANWEVADFDPARDGAALDRHHGTIDADATDLGAFRARGGKIIGYFGWADPLIAPHSGVDYYRQVAAGMGPTRVRDFYRMFMVPGMLHCQSGPGATSFGQSLPAPAGRPDRRHDIRRALEAWVESGIVPDTIIAVGNGTTRRLEPLQPR